MTPSASPARTARQGHRRGRQSRGHPARPHRGGARGHPPQHRRHRQFRRREHLRRRGELQDRADERHSRRAPRHGGARHPPRRDDRGGRRPRAAQQLAADARALARRAARARGCRIRRRAHAHARGGRPARPRVEFLPGDEALDERAHAAKALTRPEHSVLLAYAKLSLRRRILASDVPDDPYFEGELHALLPEGDARALRRTTSRDTGCAARSSRRKCPMRSSTVPARPSLPGLRVRPVSTRP